MTAVDGKAPTILTEWGARRLTARIRDALALADDLLVQAYTGRAWEALGYGDFASYCAGELPELKLLKMRAEPRRERVAKLHAEGATRTELVAATGASRGTVQGDVAAIEKRAKPAPKWAPAEQTEERNWQVAVRHVRKAGRRGMTVLEFEDATGWRHGAASAAFNSAERKGHIVRPGDIAREGYRAYVLTEEG